MRSYAAFNEEVVKRYEEWLVRVACGMRVTSNFATHCLMNAAIGNQPPRPIIRANSGDRLIGLAIDWESLFSPNHKSELNFRMAQNLASRVVG